jgi:hypothetical protein
MVEINNNIFSFSADKEQLTMDNDDDSQIDTAVAAAVTSGRQASDGDQSSVSAILSGKRRVGEASSSKEMRDGGQKKPCLFYALQNPKEEVFLSYR